jgi:xanthine dehydrogenase/oxidase
MTIDILDTQAHADAAALAVTAKYSQESKPILTIKEAIAANSFYPHTTPPLISGKGNPIDALKASKHVISGEISCGHQYHFHMETQVSILRLSFLPPARLPACLSACLSS